MVVAARESFARQYVWDYLTAKPGGNTQCQSMALFECERLEDSSDMNGYPVALTEVGVVSEYHYPALDRPQECRVVYVRNADQLAQQLSELQAKQNEGRGVSCVRNLCAYLRRKDLTSAKAVVANESDKIRSYPEIVEALKSVGFWYQIFQS